MAEGLRLLEWLRALVPALKPRRSAADRADAQGGAPVYVPAKRGAPARRGASAAGGADGRGGNDEGSPRR